MKLFKSKKWLIFCLCFFLTIGQGSVILADPLEEEEEPIQTMPNPTEKSTIKERGMNSVKADQSLKNKQGISEKRGMLKPNGASLGSSVGKDLGDDIVDPGKKTGKAMMKGKSIK